MIYWVKKPWSVRYFRPRSEDNIFSNGRDVRDDIAYSKAHFTKYGVVHVSAIPHYKQKLAKYSSEHHKYYTHYAMIHNGRLWRALSWGGEFDHKAVSYRVNKFARDVMRMTQDEDCPQPVLPSKETELEMERLKEALRGMIDLVLSLIETALPKVGIVWSTPSDYPHALRSALKLVRRNADD